MVQGQTDVFGNPVGEVEIGNGGSGGDGPIPSPTRPGGVKPVFDVPSERTPAPSLAVVISSAPNATPIPSSTSSVLSTPSASLSLLESLVPSDVPSNAPSDMPSFSPSGAPSGEPLRTSRLRIRF
jgi:hypothetical protein